MIYYATLFVFGKRQGVCVFLYLIGVYQVETLYFSLNRPMAAVIQAAAIIQASEQLR